MNEYKLKFLQSLNKENNLTDVVKLIFKYKLENNYSAYHVISHSNVNIHSKKSTSGDLLSLFKH